MMNFNFVFAKGESIDLDELDDVKDYQKLTKKFMDQYKKDKTVDYDLLKEFMAAEVWRELQITQRMHNICWATIQDKPNFTEQEKTSFHVLCLKVVQSHYLKFFYSDERIEFIKHVKEYMIGELPKDLEMWVNYFSFFAKNMNYSNNHEELTNDFFIPCPGEDKIFENEELTTIYVRSIEKMIRNSKLRMIWRNKNREVYEERFPYVAFKLSLWEQDFEKKRNHLERIKTLYKDSKSQLFQKSIERWDKQLNP